MNAKRYIWYAIGVLSIVSIMLVLVLGTSIVPAEAGPGPQTPVYSDPSVKIARVQISQEAAQASSYEGTGEVYPDDAVVISEPGVEAATALDVNTLLGLEVVSAPEGVETIIGSDTRVRVRTTTFPARSVALVTFTGGRCTGWLYGSNIVATAGHCVHSGGTGGTWKTNVRVYPGYDGTVAPYGSCTAKWLASVVGWTRDRSELYDYGVIKLNCTVGNTTGWFGLWWQSASLTAYNTNISGYPGDKSLSQWWSHDQVRVTQERQIFYYNDTVGGMSGSPIWQDRVPGSSFCTGACAMGIHAYGLHGGWPHNTYNHGTRIVQAVFNNLIAWRNAP